MCDLAPSLEAILNGARLSDPIFVDERSKLVDIIASQTKYGELVSHVHFIQRVYTFNISILQPCHLCGSRPIFLSYAGALWRSIA